MNRIYFFILLLIHTSLSAQTLLRGNVSDLEASLAKAETLNGDNPRIYLLRGTSLLYTPEQFGGGKKAASQSLKKHWKNLLTSNLKLHYILPGDRSRPPGC